jgi:hypothetical protein
VVSPPNQKLFLEAVMPRKWMGEAERRAMTWKGPWSLAAAVGKLWAPTRRELTEATVESFMVDVVVWMRILEISSFKAVERIDDVVMRMRIEKFGWGDAVFILQQRLSYEWPRNIDAL